MVPVRSSWRRARALKALVHDAVDFTVDLVEEGHESTARAAMRVLAYFPVIGPPAQLADELRRASTGLTCDSIRAVNRAVQRLSDAGIDAAVMAELLPWARTSLPDPLPMRSDLTGSAAWLTDATIGMLNGAVGDYLHREHNGLDLGMSLRRGDEYLTAASPPLSPRIAVFVHGLGTTEWSWCWDAAAYHGDPCANFGTLLERDHGIAPLYARYNSGRRVSESGRLLSDALEQFCASCEEIILVGHSMGGLVVRSACHQASLRNQRWVRRVSRVVSLGSPHRGSPLAKLAHVLPEVLEPIDHPATRIPATILRRRSAAIHDLRDGTTVEDGWLARDPDPERAPANREVPLLDHVAYTFLSATVTRDPHDPLGWLLGDVLVRVPSASGPVLRDRRFRIETRCFGGIAHHQLQNHPDVYAHLVRGFGR